MEEFLEELVREVPIDVLILDESKGKVDEEVLLLAKTLKPKYSLSSVRINRWSGERMERLGDSGRYSSSWFSTSLCSCSACARLFRTESFTGRVRVLLGIQDIYGPL